MKPKQTVTPARQTNLPVKKSARSLEKSPLRLKHRADASDSRHDDVIRRTAYDLFEARGCQAGHDLDDWLQAEAQVSQANLANTHHPSGLGKLGDAQCL